MNPLEHPLYGTIEHVVRAWDFASSEKKSADFTASCLMASTSNNYRIVLDITEDKVTPGERDQLVRNVAEMDGRSVFIFIEQEGGASGSDLIFNYVKLLKEFSVMGHKPSTSKFLRAQSLSSWLEHGLVKFVRAEWNNRVFNQLKAFPNSEHDDMVDAMSCAFNRLATVNSWSSSGSFIAAGPSQVKPMTSKQIDEMEPGPFKEILTHIRNRPRR
jgi:predicted phage terminase large subunit-like protein